MSEPINTVLSPSIAADDVQKQLAKFGREQYKLNTLIESQQRQLQTALERLSENDTRRERERTEWLVNRPTDLQQAKLKLIKQLLPVLDGLDEAITSLEHASNKPDAPRSFLQKLIGAQPESTTAISQINAWQDGLTIVRDRLLGVLANENVFPLETIGEEFDPNFHVALQHAPADETSPTGTVLREVRCGYVIGDEMLRYADVVVAK